MKDERGRQTDTATDHALLQKEIPALRRYARTLCRDHQDADDLVGECLLRALIHLETREPENALRPWLFAILRNRFISDLRRFRRQGLHVEIDTRDRALQHDPGQEWSSQLRDVGRAIDTLSDDQREILLLVTVEDLSYSEVAQLVDVPLGTVMSRLHRARERVRQYMDGSVSPVLRRVK